MGCGCHTFSAEGVTGNATRFMVLGSGVGWLPESGEHVPRGLIRLRVKGDVSAMIKTVNLPIERLDRRGDIYIIEVEANNEAVIHAARQCDGTLLGLW